MRIRMLSIASGPLGTHQVGDVVEIDEAGARPFLDGGYAERYDEAELVAGLLPGAPGPAQASPEDGPDFGVKVDTIDVVHPPSSSDIHNDPDLQTPQFRRDTGLDRDAGDRPPTRTTALEKGRLAAAARVRTEEKAKAEAEARAKAEAEQKAKAEAEQKAKAEAEQKAKAGKPAG